MPKAVVIPQQAISQGPQGPFVFVVRDDQTAEMRQVDVIGIEGDRAALNSGVKEGERVIVEGQMRLTNGTAVSEPPPGGSVPKKGVSDAKRATNAQVAP